MEDHQANMDAYREYVNSIPWNRLLSYYGGRATTVGQSLLDLFSPDKETFDRAATNLLHEIEHQDAIIVSTPFAIDCILRAISLMDDESRKQRLQDVVEIVHDAVSFGFEEDSIEHKPELTLSCLLQEEQLAPPYESEDAEDRMWDDAADWAQSDAVYQVTLNLLEKSSGSDKQS